MIQEQRSILQIRQEMARIRRMGRTPFTNYYNQCNLCTQPLEFWGEEKSCIFVWNDNGVKRVYFYSIDMESLGSLLKLVESGSCIDYITKKREDSAELFITAGFYRRLEYGRFVLGVQSKSAAEMEKILTEDNVLSKELYHAVAARPATVDEAEEVDACLREKFDLYEAHFYDMDKLRDYIRKKWVWVVRENDKIIAANLFEIQGRKVYGAYLFNNGPVEVLTSLNNTVNAYVAQLGCIHSYCWMNLANKRILRYNVTYGGYKFDGMYDMIYVKS